MGNYTEFRIESKLNNTRFYVQVKGWFGWRSGFMATDFFSINYDTLDEALDSIEKYKNRYTLKD